MLAGAPGDRLQMERGGCLFCFGGGGVSEPRTYLANEVVITPRLTNRMKTRGSTKATDGPRVCLTALQRAGCRSWKGWVLGRKRAQRLCFWEQVTPTPSSEIPENYHTPTFPKPSTAPSYLLWWEIERRLKIPNYSYPSLDRIYSQVCTYFVSSRKPLSPFGCGPVKHYEKCEPALDKEALAEREGRGGAFAGGRGLRACWEVP